MISLILQALLSLLSISLCQPITEEVPEAHLSGGHTGGIFGGLVLDHEDYEEYDYKENIENDPLPAGPTRRPDQAVPLPLNNNILDNPALSQLASLPLLTTKKPAVLHQTTRKPRTHFGLLSSKDGKVGSLLVHSSMDVVDQTRLFAEMDPFQEQFINPPKLNAGIACIKMSPNRNYHSNIFFRCFASVSSVWREPIPTF